MFLLPLPIISSASNNGTTYFLSTEREEFAHLEILHGAQHNVSPVMGVLGRTLGAQHNVLLFKGVLGRTFLVARDRIQYRLS